MEGLMLKNEGPLCLELPVQTEVWLTGTTGVYWGILRISSHWYSHDITDQMVLRRSAEDQRLSSKEDDSDRITAPLRRSDRKLSLELTVQNTMTAAFLTIWIYLNSFWWNSCSLILKYNAELIGPDHLLLHCLWFLLPGHVGLWETDELLWCLQTKAA